MEMLTAIEARIKAHNANTGNVKLTNSSIVDMELERIFREIDALSLDGETEYCCDELIDYDVASVLQILGYSLNAHVVAGEVFTMISW